MFSRLASVSSFYPGQSVVVRHTFVFPFWQRLWDLTKHQDDIAVADMVADMVDDLMADMEVDKVATNFTIFTTISSYVELDMVVDMELDKVVDKAASLESS